MKGEKLTFKDFHRGPELIAVTGANGWVGKSVVRSLLSKGFTVRSLVRVPMVASDVYFDLKLSRIRQMADALAGCKGVIHCAAHVHKPVEICDGNLFHLINAEGTRRLVEAAVLARVSRFLMISSISVYDWVNTSLNAQSVSESSAVAGTTAYARSKLGAERALMRSTLDWTVARLATVYGAGDTANFARLASALQQRRFFVPGQGTARKSIVPVSAAGQLLVDLLMAPAARGEVVNVAMPYAPTLMELCLTFCNKYRWPLPKSLPMSVFTRLAKMGDMISGMKLPTPFTSSILSKLTTSTVVDVTKQQHLLANPEWEDISAYLPDNAYSK